MKERRGHKIPKHKKEHREGSTKGQPKVRSRFLVSSLVLVSSFPSLWYVDSFCNFKFFHSCKVSTVGWKMLKQKENERKKESSQGSEVIAHCFQAYRKSIADVSSSSCFLPFSFVNQTTFIIIQFHKRMRACDDER